MSCIALYLKFLLCDGHRSRVPPAKRMDHRRHFPVSHAIELSVTPIAKERDLFGPGRRDGPTKTAKRFADDRQ